MFWIKSFIILTGKPCIAIKYKVDRRDPIDSKLQKYKLLASTVFGKTFHHKESFADGTFLVRIEEPLGLFHELNCGRAVKRSFKFLGGWQYNRVVLWALVELS